MQHNQEPGAPPYAIVVQGPIDPSTVEALTARLRAIIGTAGAGAAVPCEMGVLELDEDALDALVRLQLTARRLGGSIVLRNARGELLDLLALVGLNGVIPEE